MLLWNVRLYTRLQVEEVRAALVVGLDTGKKPGMPRILNPLPCP